MSAFHKWAFKQPKGGQARTIVIPQPLVILLAQAREIQKREITAAGDAWIEWDLCFPNALGKPQEARDDWAGWKQLCAQAGVRPVRLHDARHTAATLLLEQGVDIRVVQEILGHSTLAVTKKYTSPIGSRGTPQTEWLRPCGQIRDRPTRAS